MRNIKRSALAAAEGKEDPIGNRANIELLNIKCPMDSI